MERSAVESWVNGYVRAWRSSGTDQLADLFTPDVTYLLSPWQQPYRGLDALAKVWEDEREGPDEAFTFTSEVVAVDGATAVIRAEVEYLRPGRKTWRDLWVVRFADDGRCRSFEEWPFAPGQPDGH
jgi:ketosteroid isomerase-like protein